MLLASCLGRLDRSRTSQRIVLDADLANRWGKLNQIERYFTLLEAWWLFDELESSEGSFRAHSMYENRFLLLKGNRRGGNRKQWDPKTQEGILYFLGMKQVALMQMFGMLEIQEGPPVPGKSWNIQGMAATPWGLAACDSYRRAVMNGLMSGNNSRQMNGEKNAEQAPAFHCWGDAATPFFPAWQHSIGAPETPEPFQGSATLKVSLGKGVWRRVVLPGESSFAKLASLILRAFDFDSDHLYAFTYHDHYARKRTLCHAYSADEEDLPAADDVKLGDIGLFPGETIEFVYDFGENWRFTVLVEKLDAADIGAKPTVVAKEGKAPEQYEW